MVKKINDLIVLVADKNMAAVVFRVLTRWQSMRIRETTSKIYVHPYRDAGVLSGAHEFLRPFLNHYSYAMVLFDREGCGDFQSREAIEKMVEEHLNNSGWSSRCAVIVLDPELEIWVWSNSPHVAETLGWEQSELNLWLEKNSFRPSVSQKPERPKEAMELALREKKIPRSSAIYAEIALKVSIERCSDNGFLKFKRILQQWFPLLQKENL